jgi:NitT/TauT family transport system substrate-binding protein
MGKKRLWALLAVIVSCVIPHGLAAETLKIASPIRGSWEGAIPELGKQAGIFRKYDLDLDILYTQGCGETLQVVMSGSIDIGLSAGVLGSLGAYGKGAPLRIVGASSTGSRDTFWWVAAKSPLQSMREVDGQSIAYSTTGASSHITVLPFVLDLLSTRAARMIARASDIAAIREQTIRAQITNASNLAAKKDVIARYMKAYNETVDWMYSSPDAVPGYLAFSGLAEPAVRLMLREFIPRESLQTEKIMGLGESMKDAVQFKFLSTPLSDVQLKELIQVPAGS